MADDSQAKRKLLNFCATNFNVNVKIRKVAVDGTCRVLTRGLGDDLDALFLAINGNVSPSCGSRLAAHGCEPFLSQPPTDEELAHRFHFMRIIPTHPDNHIEGWSGAAPTTDIRG